jgi:magnesium-transporting ATPase (P-type)
VSPNGAWTLPPSPSPSPSTPPFPFFFLTKALRCRVTGESIPLPGTVESSDPNYLETRCIGMQGTHCISGSGTGIVVATGDRTVFGRIAKMTSEPKRGLTTLEREMLNFVIIICTIMLSMNVIVICVWYLNPSRYLPLCSRW